MVKSLFLYILQHTRRQQIILMLITLASFPFYYLSLDLPKTIINDAINGSQFPHDLTVSVSDYSYQLGKLDQIPYLLLLCILFLIMVLLNGGFKYVINVYRGVMGERMLRRMRFELIERIMRFPLSRFRSTGSGEIVSMVNQETEPLAGFIGESFSLPLYQGGILITILTFIFVQDWRFGCAAIALYPVQTWLIPKLQQKVNELNRERTVNVRKLAENLGETIAGIHEVHVNNAGPYCKARYSKLLGTIFFLRVQIFRNKFFIKFLNNFIAQITPFFFFLIGGILVIHGELTFGALVAVLAAYKDLSAPWKELLSWYQRQADARMRYNLLIEQFDMEGMLPEHKDVDHSFNAEHYLEQTTIANNVSWQHADGTPEVNNVSLTIKPGERILLAGTSASGKSTLAHILARLVSPTSGRLMIGEENASTLSKAVIGRIIGYAGHDSHLFSGSIRDNLLIGLKHRPIEQENVKLPGHRKKSSWSKEAKLSGNSDHDPNTNWIDPLIAGVSDHHALSERLYKTMKTVDVDIELIRNALNLTIDTTEQEALKDKILQARYLFHDKLESRDLLDAVEPLDPQKYNDNSSLAENILFGTPTDAEFAIENLSEHPLIRSLLAENKLSDTMDDAAVRTAATMVELFSDLPPGHEFFERYSFVDTEDLVTLKSTLALLDQKSSIDTLPDTERKLLRSLPYRVIASRHRLDILQDDEKQRILNMRRSFAEQLDEESRSSIEFFAPHAYNTASSISENIMFGRIAFSRLHAAERVHQLMLDVLHEFGIAQHILEIGLNGFVGLSGSRLALSQRQKLVLCRALMKQPKLLVINEGLNSLDTVSLKKILSNLIEEYPKTSLLWVDSQIQFEELFDSALFLEAGRIVKRQSLTT